MHRHRCAMVPSYALVVDPDPDRRARLAVVVSRQGLAVRAVKTFGAASRYFDRGWSLRLAILKFPSPAAEASAFCGRLAAYSPRPLILALTDDAIADRVARALGADAILGLPVEPRVLETTIRALLLDGSSGSAEPAVPGTDIAWSESPEGSPERGGRLT